MTDPQELANRIGATQRATEAAIAANDMTTAAAKATEQHANLREGFAFLRDVLDLDLDWDQVAGNRGTSAKGAHTNTGGGPKDPPPPSE